MNRLLAALSFMQILMTLSESSSFCLFPSSFSLLPSSSSLIPSSFFLLLCSSFLLPSPFSRPPSFCCVDHSLSQLPFHSLLLLQSSPSPYYTLHSSFPIKKLNISRPIKNPTIRRFFTPPNPTYPTINIRIPPIVYNMGISIPCPNQTNNSSNYLR